MTQLHLFENLPAETREQLSLPLVNLGDTVYRFELRFRWCPAEDKASVAAEVTDDHTGELLGWILLPVAAGNAQLVERQVEAAEWLGEMRRYLEEPFPEGPPQRKRSR